MAAGSTPAEISASDRSWFIARRWMAYEAEARANLLRIIAIGAFYLVHLWSYFSPKGGCQISAFCSWLARAK